MKRIAFAALASLALIGAAHAESIGVLNNPLLKPDLGLALRKAGLDCAAMAGNYGVTKEVSESAPLVVNHVYCDGAPRGQWYAVSVNFYTLQPVTFAPIDPPANALAPSLLSLK